MISHKVPGVRETDLPLENSIDSCIKYKLVRTALRNSLLSTFNRVGTRASERSWSGNALKITVDERVAPSENAGVTLSHILRRMPSFEKDVSPARYGMMGAYRADNRSRATLHMHGENRCDGCTRRFWKGRVQVLNKENGWHCGTAAGRPEGTSQQELEIESSLQP